MTGQPPPQWPPISTLCMGGTLVDGLRASVGGRATLHAVPAAHAHACHPWRGGGILLTGCGTDVAPSHTVVARMQVREGMYGGVQG